MPIGGAAIAWCCSAQTASVIATRRTPLLDEIKRTPGISSVQITFHEELPPERHSMPPGGFRLAVVNGFDLAAALAARERLKGHFLRGSDHGIATVDRADVGPL